MAESRRNQSRGPVENGGRGHSSTRPETVVDLPAAIELPLAALRSGGNGILLDHGAEVSAALDATVGFGDGSTIGQRYRNNLEAEVERDRYYSQAYPRVWKGGHDAGVVSGTLAALLSDAPTIMATSFLPRSAVVAANTRRAVPFIREGYGTMGAVGGGLVGAGGQLVDDAGRGRLSNFGDVTRAGVGGAVGGWTATHGGRPVLGAAIGSGLTTALQDQAHQGSVALGDTLKSIQSGAYFGQAMNGLGKYGSTLLPSPMKGSLGEALTFLKSYARGEPIPLRPTPSAVAARRLPGLVGGMAGGQQTIKLEGGGKTVPDWITSQGRALEAKFGAYARPTEAQKRAAKQFGDAFVFDHSLPKNAGEVVSALFGAPTGYAAGRLTPNR